MVEKTISLDEYRSLTGEEMGVSRWFAIDQTRIDRFAEVTEDFQYIHVDAAAAAVGPFGTTIAHGYLTLSLLTAMAAECVPVLEGQKLGINYGFNSLRFLSPVMVNSRIRGRFRLREVALNQDLSCKSVFDVTVEIENQGKPALVAEWITFSVLAAGS